jgi:2-iminobutanoate/2-iminopropanoate deaminase
MVTFLNSESNPGAEYGLSSGVAVGEYVFAAGMALDWDTLQRTEAAETIADEVGICLANLEERLKMAGCSLRDVVKTTCWLTDEVYRPEFIAAYKEVFDPGPYPARATLIAGIAGGCRVEIDAVAIKPDAAG